MINDFLVGVNLLNVTALCNEAIINEQYFDKSASNGSRKSLSSLRPLHTRAALSHVDAPKTCCYWKWERLRG